MSKRLWIGLAAVPVIAVIIVTALVLPDLFKDKPINIEGNTPVMVTPGHWWKTNLTEEQFKLLKDSWGNDMTTIALLQMISPDIIPELPQDMVDAWEITPVSWPTKDWNNFLDTIRLVPLTYSIARPNDRDRWYDGGYKFYSFYLGRKGGDKPTDRTMAFMKVTSEVAFRISLYIDDAMVTVEKEKGGIQSQE